MLYVPEIVLKEITNYFFDTEYDVFLVGGYLRDMLLLKKNSNDFDFALRSNKNIGVLRSFVVRDLVFKPPFWSVKKKVKDYVLHFSLFRKEILKSNFVLEYELTNNIYDDVYRRDLIVNSLYYDVFKKEVLDMFNVLKKNITVLEPISYFNTFFTDPSRIIRAVRYSKLTSIPYDPIVLEEALLFFKNYSSKFSLPKFNFKKELKKTSSLLENEEKLWLNSYLI